MHSGLIHFTRALAAPDLAFDLLRDAEPLGLAHGVPRIVRTSRFAEAEIRWQGSCWIVALPLTPAVLPRIERTVAALGRLNAAWVPALRILTDELRWTDDTGRLRTASLLLQHLPEGCPFDEALRCVSATALHAALDRLKERMQAAAMAHNNLKPENLLWAGGRFVPLRCYDATFGSAAEADAEAIDRLHREIDTHAALRSAMTLHDTETPYEAPPQLTGHCWVSHLFEGLVCVEDPTGYGYVDVHNRPVIASQFRWAGDFREGRAEVETFDGRMGLIDRTGSYVIPPEYEIVDYDAAASVVRVRRQGAWALFDYLGRQLTPFGPLDEILRER